MNALVIVHIPRRAHFFVTSTYKCAGAISMVISLQAVTYTLLHNITQHCIGNYSGHPPMRSVVAQMDMSFRHVLVFTRGLLDLEQSQVSVHTPQASLKTDIIGEWSVADAVQRYLLKKNHFFVEWFLNCFFSTRGIVGDMQNTIAMLLCEPKSLQMGQLTSRLQHCWNWGLHPSNRW